MAKLKGPLFSLGASGQLAKTLVFFPWKGLNVAREHVTPANPQTTAQTTQRGYMTSAIAALRTAQGHATQPMTETDISAMSLWGSIYATPRTWFNQFVKNAIEQLVAGLSQCVYTQGTTTPGASSLAVSLFNMSGPQTAGNFHYGTSKTNLVNTQAANFAANPITGTLAGLTTGVKYFWQFRPTAAAGAVGAYSGIYYGVAA